MTTKPDEIIKTEQNGREYYLDEDGHWIEERWCCRRCLDQGIVRCADEQYSLGVYAGKYCPKCWLKSGYVDATDPDAEFDPDYAGERMEADY